MDKVEDEIKDLENGCKVSSSDKALLDLVKCIKDTARCCFKAD